MTFTLPTGIQALYRGLHRHPELAMREHRTARVCAARLERAGFSVRTGVAGTGVVAELRRGAGPTVVLRAELDALPLTERTGASFSSRVEGVMHACGHDLHLAAVVAAAEQVGRQSQDWSGCLVVVLQPAEETGTGARAMLDGGLLDMVPRVDRLLAQHVSALAPVGVIVSTPGIALAASETFRVEVRGEGGHSSAVDRSTQPVLVAASLVMRLATLVSQEVAPFEQAVVSIPEIVAPSAPGLVAPQATVTITTRSVASRVGTLLADRIECLVSAEALGAGLTVGADADVRLSKEASVLSVCNDEALLSEVRDAHRAGLGLTHLTVPPALASDDVSVLTQAFDCPAAYWFVGSGEPGGKLGATRPGCHTDRYLPNPHTLAVAASAMRLAALAALNGR